MSEARKENNQVEKSIVLSDPQAHVMFTTKELNLDMAGQRGGKSQMIGIIAGEYITQYPKLKGFIGANTYLQLSQSTLIKCFEIWAENYTLTQYDRKNNPYGDYVVDKRPPEHFKTFEQFKDYNNIISFKNGGIIYLGSLDNWKAHDGKEFCWGHLDETKDTREEAIKGVILARLSQSGLYLNEEKKIVYDVELSREDAEKKKLKSFNPCWIHTSPAIGQTPEWLINMFDLTRFEEEIRKTIVKPDDFFYRGFGRKSVTIFSTYHNQKNLPNGYIEGRLSVLSENEAMKLVYGYPFSKTGSEYFPKFERVKHVKKIEPQPFGLKHVTFDFNVVPYMTMLSAQIRYQIRYIDAQGIKHDEPDKGRLPIEVMIIEFIKEYCLETPLNTTEQCCLHFIEDNAGNPSLEVFYYGDASGNARIEGLGSLTNYKIVEQHLKMYLVEGSKRVRGVNLGVLTRRDLMNRILEGKIPEVELYFDEEMVNTIRDFEYLKLGADGKLKEKAKDKDTGALYEKIGHTSDATEYLVCEILKHYITIN